MLQVIHSDANSTCVYFCTDVCPQLYEHSFKTEAFARAKFEPVVLTENLRISLTRRESDEKVEANGPNICSFSDFLNLLREHTPDLPTGE